MYLQAQAAKSVMCLISKAMVTNMSAAAVDPTNGRKNRNSWRTHFSSIPSVTHDPPLLPSGTASPKPVVLQRYCVSDNL